MPDRPMRRVTFERNSARVIFDASSGSFRVTWSKSGKPLEDRLAACKDPVRWIPSVCAVATLYDRGAVPSEQVFAAARAIGKAWEAGDRELLDTEGAKKAAELVHDLSSMCVDSHSPAVVCDLGHALRHLLDELAAVRFSNFPRDMMDPKTVLPALGQALDVCLSRPDFLSWPSRSMRKKFIYLLRDASTDLTTSLLSLLFDTGNCPLLSLSDRRSLRLRALQESGLDEQFARAQVMLFFRFALEQIVKAKDEDRNCLGTVMTQQQLADSLNASSS